MKHQIQYQIKPYYKKQPNGMGKTHNVLLRDTGNAHFSYT